MRNSDVLLNHLSKLPDNLEGLQQATAEIYKQNLFLTAKFLLDYRDITNFTHGNVIRTLESDTPRKLIVMPRGTFKSSIASVSYPIWKLLRNPNERILIDSEIYSNSKNFLREIKTHLCNDKLVDLFGEFKTRSCWNEGEIIIKQRTQNYKEASITCSGIGAGKTSQHYSTIIADDLNGPSNSLTTEGRQKVIEHYRYYTSLLEPGGTLVIVGTRYAADDIIGTVIQNEIRGVA